MVQGPRGVIDLSPGELRACALLIEAAGETVPRAELARMCAVGGKMSRHALEQTISRLRSRLRRRGGCTVTVVATRREGWRLVAGKGSPYNRQSDQMPKT